MLLKNKAKAFTLSEMLVVLALTSVVISLSVVLLGVLQKQLGNLYETSQKVTEICLFERVLLRDFQNGNVHYNPIEKRLTTVSEMETVVYLFEPDFVLRNNDTLAVAIVDFALFMDAVQVSSGPVDAIDLHFENTKIFVSKQKDATFYTDRLWASN